MARRARPSTWVVQRLAVHPWEWGDGVTLSPKGDDKYASFVPLCGLPTEALAKSKCRQLESEARRATSIGPFLRVLLPEKAADIASAAAAAGLTPRTCRRSARSSSRSRSITAAAWS